MGFLKFYFSTWKSMWHVFLVFIIYHKSTIIWIAFLFLCMALFSQTNFNFLSLVLRNFTIICFGEHFISLSFSVFTQLLESIDSWHMPNMGSFRSLFLQLLFSDSTFFFFFFNKIPLTPFLIFCYNITVPYFLLIPF